MASNYSKQHNLFLPQVLIALVGVLFNVVAQYLLVVYLQFGIAGSAVGLTMAQYIMAAGYILYIRFSHLYKQTWGGWSVESLYGWYHYLKYGVPGMIMLCYEWGSFESGYFALGGFAPYPKVELGIYSVLINFAGIAFSLPLGFMIAATVRVGNLLGQNEPRRARQSCYLSLLLICVVNSILCFCMYLARNHLALLFTSDECILAGSEWAVMIVAVFQVADGYQGVAGGAIKGCGKQKFGAVTNLITYQFISLPLAFVLAFRGEAVYGWVLDWFGGWFYLYRESVTRSFYSVLTGGSVPSLLCKMLAWVKGKVMKQKKLFSQRIIQILREMLKQKRALKSSLRWKTPQRMNWGSQDCWKYQRRANRNQRENSTLC